MKIFYLPNPVAEGILLYPAVGYQFSEHYVIGGHQLSVETIDLSKDWRDQFETHIMKYSTMEISLSFPNLSLFKMKTSISAGR